MLGAQMRAWASSWMQVGSRRQHFTCPADPSQWWDNRHTKVCGEASFFEIGLSCCSRFRSVLSLDRCNELRFLESSCSFGGCSVKVGLLGGFPVNGFNSDRGSGIVLGCVQINPGSPDFRHKARRKALWVDGWSTPQWAILGELQPPFGHRTQGPQDVVRPSRYTYLFNPSFMNDEQKLWTLFYWPFGHRTCSSFCEVLFLKKKMEWNSSDKELFDEAGYPRRGSPQPTYARESRQNVQVDYAIMRMRSASALSDAVAVLKDLIHQGVTLDSYIYVEVLQRCFRQKDLRSAEQVHDCVTRSGMEQNVYVANNMLRVYIRCGKLQEARQVFDKLVRKSVVSWTIMIGGYAQRAHAMDAFELFNQMRQEGAQPNEVTYLSILKACANPAALKWGKEVHGHIRLGGFLSDMRVGTALLQMYAKCGSITEAREVFDNLPKRDIIAWTGMIGAYAEYGRGHEAYELFLQMQQQGYKPDAFIFTSLLNQRSSAAAGALEWVKDVHAHAVQAGLEMDVRVANGLINMYAKCGSVDNARRVFDRMVNRNIVSWNVIIGAYAENGCGAEAYQLFLQMQQEGFIPDTFTYLAILNPCASVGALEWVKEVHAKARNVGLDTGVCVGTALVGMYAMSSSMDDAREVFDKTVSRDVTSWNVMIGAYAEHGCGAQAYQLFSQMQQDGFVPDKFTYLGILKPCAEPGALDWVRKVHAQAFQAGLHSDLSVGNALIHIYAKSGSIDDARLIFDGLMERDVITWNSMIGGYAGIGRGHEAYELLLQMQREGFPPNATTYLSILNASASPGALQWVKRAHELARQAGLESDLRVGNALVHMYARSGSIDDARLVFHKLTERDVISWNVMIGALAQHGFGHEALQVYKQMKTEGFKPNERTFVAVLSACSHAGLVDEARRQFLAMTEDNDITPSVVHYACMVDVLGRSGCLEEAKLFIQNMPIEPDGATWGALLGACRTHGNVEMAELAFKGRIRLGPKDSSPYILLSNIYASAGRWDQVASLRALMQERGIRKEPGRSWIEVAGKINHFYMGDTCHPEAKEISAAWEKLFEMMKAQGYSPDTRLVLRDIDEEDKELALCSHSEKLAITYGLMHVPSGEVIRVFKNLRVCSDCHTATKFISKVTGREIVARDANRFHHFKDGVCSCGDYW
jgi:pentatricopeptide repeat protein